MTDDAKRYWKGLEELEEQGPLEPRSELGIAPGADELAVDRRNFLKLAGFTLGAGALAGCGRSAVETAIPYLSASEQVVPGRSYWLASTCGACPAACGILVKCRDGRPLKVEGNPEHPVSRGGLCAVGQASLLELYDSRRPHHPLFDGNESEWSAVDAEVSRRLGETEGARIRLLTGTIHSPSMLGAIAEFLARYPGARHDTYDALSSSAILDAHERTHGSRILPRYHFDRAEAIVSFDADFLSTWVSPVEHSAGWAEKRRPTLASSSMSWHFQLEPRMSLTGSKADQRHRLLPSQFGPVLRAILARLEGSSAEETEIDPAVLDRVAGRLEEHRGASLVVSGSQRLSDQILVNLINERLGNYGATIDLARPSNQRRGSDRSVAMLLDELRAGSIDVLIVAEANPLYDFAAKGEFAKLFSSVPLTIAVSETLDETAVAARLVAPVPHFLESWGDGEPVRGVVSFTQPAIAPFFNSRTLGESLSAWSGKPAKARDSIVAALGTEAAGAGQFERALERGFLELPRPTSSALFRSEVAIPSPPEESASELTLVLYPKVAIGAGRHAENPWLQELPDPITKITWDNYASISPSLAKSLGVESGDVLRIEASGETIDLPALIQPGQHDRVVAIALGYGRVGTERFAETGPKWLFGRKTIGKGERVGRNASPFLRRAGGELLYDRAGVTVAKSGRKHPLAATQLHHTLELPEHLASRTEERREIIEETTLAAYTADSHAGAAHEHPKADLWSEHTYPVHRWAMAIDLNACTGCAGCVVGCQAENNIPVVGKDEVLRQREMHWIRIDRYYSGGPDDPEVVHQPMLCQHCANAPCETVCPVLATVHSSEGLNQQVYNRCVGTRYCANNCPYKTRRFNWFDYPREDRYQNLALNPDVTVRSRGVMEKCSFCVQRIEEAKIEAKRLGVRMSDGDARPACQQSCPSKAIVFGDLNDPKSLISAARNDPRHFVVLGELNVQPSVGYMRLVRNREEKETRLHGHREDKHV